MTTSPLRSGGAPSFWSCFTHQRRDPFSLRYGDELGERYDYDSNVRNSRQVAVGDVVIVRDDHLAYGWGAITKIDSRPGIKVMERCPECASTKRSTRTTVTPRHRCQRCKAEFHDPVLSKEHVTEYSALYGLNWIEFVAPAPAGELKGLFASKDRQNAIRSLDPIATLDFIEAHVGVSVTATSADVDGLAEWVRYGGLVVTQARVRRHQTEFRVRLIERFGDVCAITGRQPIEVLDAAHLYSYATQPVHRERGGLLMRKDVHRLFDTMLLTIEPGDVTSRVAPALLDSFPSLEPLDGRVLQVPEHRLPDLGLLAAHADAAHGRWRSLKNELAGRLP